MANAVNQPMVDILAPALTSEVIKFCSDVSGRADLGYGCILDQSWISGTWDHELMLHEPSIEYLELFALVLGLLTWEERLSNCRIIIFCDNISVVHMVNSMSSSCANCMILIRLMILNGLRCNRQVTMQYIDTKLNFLADALSRNQMDHFRCLGPHMNAEPDQPYPGMLPTSRLWVKL